LTDNSKTRKRKGPRPRHEMVGLAPRRLAVGIVDGVLRERRAADSAFDAWHGNPVLLALNARDRAFTRNLVAVTLRHLGWLRRSLQAHMQKRLRARSGAAEAILLVAAAQILCLRTADHAAVDQAVRLATEDRNARHFSALINGVLRNLIRSRDAGGIVDHEPGDALPDWLSDRWRARFGVPDFQALSAQLLQEPPLDISLKHASSAPDWAERLGGILLANGSLRLAPGAGGALEQLEGYADGAWWVQDAAARLPALLLGEVDGQRVADLAAAPGGKTAQLAAAGAHVTSVDKSNSRLNRLSENLSRLRLTADTHVADARTWQPDAPFDAVLLDAPCSATGTLRRHPDIAWIRREGDIATLAEIQSRLLANAAKMVCPGGLIVYATCSLEAEEGVDQIGAFLKANAGFQRVPVTPEEIGGLSAAIAEHGDVQTRPDFRFARAAPQGHASSLAEDQLDLERGMDGFFMARLRRVS
jgi:16S rRNA (cytosine967-C5)-methyltransferase